MVEIMVNFSVMGKIRPKICHVLCTIFGLLHVRHDSAVILTQARSSCQQLQVFVNVSFRIISNINY